MKVAVSIPDPVFSDAEKLAIRLKLSRSKIYARALEEFVANHNLDSVTDSMNAALAAVGEESEDFVRRAANAAIQHSEW